MAGAGGDRDARDLRTAADFDATSADVEPLQGDAGRSDGQGGTCPDRESLELLAAGATNLSGVASHLDRCPICREVVDRLRADNALLSDFVTANRDRFDSDRSPSRPPPEVEVVPGFRVAGEIHRGAQGVVYRAQQTSTRRHVALKTLLQGKFATSRQRARFDREVEVVASLRHPHIVTLYESGRTADGLAFFAMELVDGRPLSDILKLPEGSGEKPTAARLIQTYLQIVKAIAYAHQRGVIHRDLKPANILIDGELEPHVLDFGLARSARGEEQDQDMIESTAAGEFLGTFAYAAPEQLRGNPDLIDVRTDIFALGVILYEILAGERPYKPPGGSFSIADLLLARLETEPKAPSTVRPGVDPDLDVITLTCLKSKPEERYQSAQALAEDLERFLDGRPILARRDSLVYVARKWVRRHWVATSVAVGFVLLIVASTIALAVSRGIAKRNEERANRTLDAFRETFQSSNPEIGRGKRDMNVLQFLGLLREQAIAEFEVDPLVGSTLLNTIEASWLGFDGALRPKAALEEVLELCLTSAARDGRSDTPQLAEATHNLARWYLKSGDLVEAERLYRDALAMWTRLDGENAPRSAMTMQHLAACLRDRGELDGADALLRRARAVQAKTHGESSWEVAAIVNAQASVLLRRGERDAALAAFEDALARIRRAVRADDFRVGRAHFSIGRLKRSLGRPGALDDLMIAERVIVGAKGEASPEAIDARIELALAQLDAGDAQAALEPLDRAIQAGLPVDEPNIRRAELHEARGKALVALARPVDAVAAFREALAAARASGPSAGSSSQAEAIAARSARALRAAGFVAEAERMEAASSETSPPSASPGS
jgi:serine/threonine protein kinase/Tfp pilus assembly protein PilF